MRYFIRYDDEPEREVTRAEFIAEERRWDFRSQQGPRTVATAGFGVHGRSTSPHQVRGRVER